MITKQELQAHARRLGLRPDHAEKNYLHLTTLFAISRTAPEKLVFKGGTALMIVHGLNRFSEDLDFTADSQDDTDETLEQARRFLEQAGIHAELTRTNTTEISAAYTLRFQGPLYDGTRQTTSKIDLDISTREPVTEEPDMARIIHQYQDIPTYHVRAMAPKEILAEKVRATMTRHKARDVFDIEFLLAKGVRPDRELIDKKMAYYGERFTTAAFEKALEGKRRLWKPELDGLVDVTPRFDETKRRIMEVFRTAPPEE